ncbi:MAG: flagellar protein FlgN [Gammaproteobacteria bacterium]|jgi:flagellar biosynthesis/type III secretory pathway chaperone|nr:flagellar protein FlgN [Gammaproteobacteria bacterium]
MLPGSALAEIFEQEIDSLTQLQSILQQEYDALVNADIDAIESLSARKNAALTLQAKLTQARQGMVRDAALSDTPEGLQQLITQSQDSEALALAYRKLTELAALCHESNRINGRLIVQKQRQANEALDILRRTDSAAPTYSSQGKTASTGPGGRTLGKA